MSAMSLPVTVERWSDKQGDKGISIKDGNGLCIANMVGQLDDSELKKAHEIVRAANCHAELLEACQEALTFWHEGKEGMTQLQYHAGVDRVEGLLRAAIGKAGGRT